MKHATRTLTLIALLLLFSLALNAQGVPSLVVFGVEPDEIDYMPQVPQGELPQAPLKIAANTPDTPLTPELNLGAGDTACDGGALSFLDVGSHAIVAPMAQAHDVAEEIVTERLAMIVDAVRVNEYAQPSMPDVFVMPWDMRFGSISDAFGGLEEWLEELGEEGDFPADEPLPNGFLTFAVPVGTIVEVVGGPYCSERFGDATDLKKWTETYTWWQVSATVDGVTYPFVWLPETVFEQDSESDTKFLTVLLRPHHIVEVNPCIGVLPSQLFASLEVEPGPGPLNIRAAPNGEIVGRLGMGDKVTLAGPPECAGGTHWWPTDRGWIAERDPDTQVALLLPAVQAAREAARRDPPPPTQSAQEAPPQVAPPIVQVTAQPTRPPRPTPTPSDPIGAPGQPPKR